MDHHAQRMRSYIDALEEEKRKIQVFQRELPLCLELVNKAIENYRQQLSGTTTEYVHGGQSECSEQTSTQGPVLEEFIPIKRPCSGSDDEDAELDSGRKPSQVNGTVAISVSDNKRKSDWLRSAQLWNQTSPDPPPKDDPQPKRVPVLEVKRSGGAFQPFNREKGAVVEGGNKSYANRQSLFYLDKANSAVPAAAASSTADTAAASAVSSRKEDREPAQPDRKQRRNWSPELHRRFLQALQQLGGSHAATPKQIRELMKVDGLTNDEVKSHLQKYRLHTRRPGPSTIPAAGAAQAPQFMVVGGIWVPSAEYTAVAATASSGEAKKPSAVYAPLAAPPPANFDQKKQPDESEGRGSHSAGGEEASGGRSNSPSTSSSSHTTTVSRLH